MEELQSITEKYQPEYIGESFSSLEGVNRFALTFYKDVAEIYDCLTRLKLIERNPSGFSIDDAPVLGLLVRVWKLLKEVIKYYEQNNAEIIALPGRYPLCNSASEIHDAPLPALVSEDRCL